MSSKNQTELNHLVREYLSRQTGYEHIVEEMDKMIASNEPAKNTKPPKNTEPNIIPTMTLSSKLPTKLAEYALANIAQDLIVVGLTDGDYNIYNESYDTLRSWACTSLDFIKHELLSLCYPIFAHCYINLIRTKNYQDAEKFWSLWEHDHLENHYDHIQQLSMLKDSSQLTDPVFLKANPYVYSIVHSRFIMSISSFGLKLFTSFLIQHDLLAISSIVNEKIMFYTLAHPLDSNLCNLELRGYLESKQNRYHVQPLALGVPGNLEGIDMESALDNVKLPDTREDKLYREWLKRLVWPKILLGQRKQKISKDVPRANPLEPSIIFATLTNTYDGMTSLNIDKGVIQACAGFRDSSVRVWRLDNTYSDDNDWNMTEVLPKIKTNYVANKPKKRARTGVNMLEFHGHHKVVLGVSQDDTNRLLLSSSADESIRLWDLVVRQCVAKYNCITPAWDVSFGPFGYYFASANIDRTVCVYSTDRVTPVRMMTGHVSDVTCCRWHDNGTFVISGSDDNTVRLWDIRTGSSVRVMKGSNSSISSVAISPNGKYAASGNDKGIIHVWDLASGSNLCILEGHSTKHTINSVAFSADNNALSSGSSDCTVRIWDLLSSVEDAKNKAFSTKYSPVYHVGYTAHNVLCAGGPFVLPSKLSAASTSEIQTISALGLGVAMQQGV